MSAPPPDPSSASPPDPPSSAGRAPDHPALARALEAFRAGDHRAARAALNLLQGQALDAGDQRWQAFVRRGLALDPAILLVAAICLLLWSYLFITVAL